MMKLPYLNWQITAHLLTAAAFCSLSHLSHRVRAFTFASDITPNAATNSPETVPYDTPTKA